MAPRMIARSRRVWFALLLLALAVTLSGCSALESPTALPAEQARLYYTGLGAPQVTPGMAARAEALYDEKKACVGWTGHPVRQLEVEVYVGPFICPGSTAGGTGVLANGCQWPSKLGVNIHTFEGAVGHELVHYFSGKVGYPPDPLHTGHVWRKCMPEDYGLSDSAALD